MNYRYIVPIVSLLCLFKRAYANFTVKRQQEVEVVAKKLLDFATPVMEFLVAVADAHPVAKVSFVNHC